MFRIYTSMSEAGMNYDRKSVLGFSRVNFRLSGHVRVEIQIIDSNNESCMNCIFFDTNNKPVVLVDL
jgi:hypothetical protein